MCYVSNPFMLLCGWADGGRGVGLGVGGVVAGHGAEDGGGVG